MLKVKRIINRIIAIMLVLAMVSECGITEVLGASAETIDVTADTTDVTEEDGTSAGSNTLAGIGATTMETSETGTTETVTTESEEDSYIIVEDPAKREQSVKHFLLENGDYVAVMYPEPVHYEKDGVWEEIDNRLFLAGGEGGTDQSYVNRASDVRVGFARYSNAEDLVSIQTEAGIVSWSLVTEETVGQQEAGEQRSEEAVTGDTEEAAQELTQENAEGMPREAITEGEEITEPEAIAEGEEAAEPEAIAQDIETVEDAVPETEQPVSEFMPFAEEDAAGQAAFMTLGLEETEDMMFIEAEGSREGRTAAEYNEEQTAVSGLTSGGIYEEILPGVDIQYVLDTVRLKENIILKTADAVQEQYTFRVSHPDMEMVLEEDGSVSLKGKGEDADISYTFLSPFMYDSEDAYSASVDYVLTPDGEDATLLSICPDTGWLLAEERSYPVTIDPMTETSRNTKLVIDTFVCEKDPDGSANDVGLWGQMAVGYVPSYGKCRTLVKLSGLPALEQGDIIYKGIFALCWGGPGLSGGSRCG